MDNISRCEFVLSLKITFFFHFFWQSGLDEWQLAIKMFKFSWSLPEQTEVNTFIYDNLMIHR